MLNLAGTLSIQTFCSVLFPDLRKSGISSYVKVFCITLLFLLFSANVHAQWEISTIDTDPQFRGASIALDSHGMPHIAYGNWTGLRYASWNGSSWNVEVVDTSCMAGNNCSLVLDSNDKPHIAYDSGNPTPNDVSICHIKYAEKTGANWVIETIASESTNGSVQIQNPCLALSSDGVPYITYQDIRERAMGYAEKEQSQWNVTYFRDTGALGGSNAIKFDSQQKIHMAYSEAGLFDNDRRVGRARYLAPDTTGWQKIEIPNDFRGDDSGYYGIGSISMDLDKLDKPHFVISENGGALTYLHWTGVEWSTHIIMTSQESPSEMSVAIDSKNLPHILFRDSTLTLLPSGQWQRNDRKPIYAGLTPNGWIVETLPDSCSLVGNLVVDGAGIVHICYRDAAGQLKYAKGTPDITPPQCFTDPEGRWLSTRTLPTISGTATDNFSGVTRVEVAMGKYPYDNLTWNLASGTTVWNYVPGPLQDGDYQVFVRARDGSGNISTPIKGAYVRYDTTPPVTTSVRWPPGAETGITAQRYIGAKATDNLTGVGSYNLRLCDESAGTYWNGSSWQTAEAWFSLGVSDDYAGSLPAMEGNHHYWVTVRSVDPVGNVEAIGKEIRFVFYANLAPNVMDWTFHKSSISDFDSTAIAVDKENQPHIAITKFNQPIRYANYNVNNGWIVQSPDPSVVTNLECSIAVDDKNEPRIAYEDLGAQLENQNLKWAYRMSGVWHTQTIDADGNVGLSPAISVDSSNHTYIAYIRHDGTVVRFARSDGSTWQLQNIWSNAGYIKCSLALDSMDKPHVAFGVYGPNESFGPVKYASLENSGWEIQNPANQISGTDKFKVMVGIDNVPHIIGHSSTDNGLGHSYLAGPSWSNERIDSDSPPRLVGDFASAAVDSFGKVHIIYVDKSNAMNLVSNGGMWTDQVEVQRLVLKHAYQSVSGWTVETIANGGGMYNSIAIDASNNIHIVYQDTDGTLTYAVRGSVKDTVPPISRILLPGNDSAFSHSFTVSGTASDGYSGIDYVEVGIGNINSGTWEWHRADGRENWTFQVPGMTDGSYEIASRATDRAGNQETISSRINVRIDATPPDKVQNLSVSTAELTVSLSWQASAAADLAGYRIYKSSMPDSGEQLMSTTAQTSIIDKAVVGDTTYYYRVAAFDTIGNEGLKSNQIAIFVEHIKRPPKPPTDLKATVVSATSIRLNWANSPSTDVSEYRIYMSTGNMDYSHPAVVTTYPKDSYTFEGLQPATEYHFVVRAKNADGEEQNTDIVAARTLPVQPPDVCLGMNITSPTNGKKVGGERLMISADPICTDARGISMVRFEYRLTDATLWLPVPAADKNHPNPDNDTPYFVHWDLRDQTPGDYQIRAVGVGAGYREDTSGGFVTVHLDHANPDSVEVISDDGSLQKTEKVQNYKTSVVTSDANNGLITVTLPSGAVTEEEVNMQIVVNPPNPPAPPSNTQSLATTIKIDLSNNQHILEKTAELCLPYQDDDNDGREDRTGMDASSLCIYHFNEGSQTWESIPSKVDVAQKKITAETGHFSLFALFALTGPTQVMVEPPMPHADPTFRKGEIYAFPNPARAGRRPVIHIEAGIADHVKVGIYDLSGALIKEVSLTDVPIIFDDGHGPKYAYEYSWDVSNVASGLYLYIVHASKSGHGDFKASGKVAVIK